MSDTDEDLVPHSFQKFQRENTVIHTQSSQPNMYNMAPSNFNMPHQFMGSDQRSMYSRRETSPMSLRSFPASRMQYQPYYPQRAMSSRGSVYNSRCMSPMSVRSNCSSATSVAVNISLAFKSEVFSERDVRMIKKAYNMYIKHLYHRRIKKRRNLKTFMKECRRNSGSESGHEGSNSSLSSDDCGSTRSAFYTRNLPKVRARQSRMDLNKITAQVRDNDICTDHTENLKQSSFQNFLLAQSRSTYHSFLPPHKQQNFTHDNRHCDLSATPRDQANESHTEPIVTLKDRLAKNSSLLPIERFNRSNVNPTFEVSYKVKSNRAIQKKSASNNRHIESENESDEIFASTSRANMSQPNGLNQKRVLEANDVDCPEKKRQKLTTSPVKQNKSISAKNMKKVTSNFNDFNFKKPLMPIRKLGTLIRDKEPEVLITKSTQPLVGNVEPLSKQLNEMPQTQVHVEVLDSEKESKNKTTNNNTVADTTQNSTVSMKPSFTKRKLFTQTLDIVENINGSNSSVNSPQTKSLRACREKTKVRKLTSQSCLNRDVSDNNYMDLLHHFLPSDKAKNQTTEYNNKGNKKGATKNSTLEDDEDNWDVNVAMSICGSGNCSETYTDEEIFNAPKKEQVKTKQVNNKKSVRKTNSTGASQKKHSPVLSACKVVLKRIKDTPDVSENHNEQAEKQCPTNRTVNNFVKSFWETDYESDMEDGITPSLQKTTLKDQIPTNSQFLMSSLNGIGNRTPRKTVLTARNSCKQVNQSKKLDNPQLKGKMLDNLKENNNDIMIYTRKTRSCSIYNTSNIQNESMNSNKTNTNKKKNNSVVKTSEKNQKNNISQKNNNAVKSKISQKSNNNSEKNNSPQKNKRTKSQVSKSSSKIKNKQSESIFNISRESLRLKQKREASSKNSSISQNTSPNTSRESSRLKQKREAKLNGTYCENKYCNLIKCGQTN